MNYTSPTGPSFRYLTDGQGALAVEVNEQGYVTFDSYSPISPPQDLLSGLEEALGITFWIPEECEEKWYFYSMDEAHTAKIDDRLFLNIIRKSRGDMDERDVEQVKRGISAIVLGLESGLDEEVGKEEMEKRVNACTAIFLSWYARTFPFMFQKEQMNSSEGSMNQVRESQ